MSQSATGPIPNSYVVPGIRLMAGEYPGDRDPDVAAARLAAFLDAGVTTFIDLTTSEDGLEPYEPILRHLAFRLHAERLNFPIRDVRVTDDEGMCRVLDAVDNALAAGRAVYVHCWGGVGRTGTVIGCWLVRQGSSGDEALREVARLFQLMTPEKVSVNPGGSPETKRQREMIRGWQAAEERARRKIRGHV